MKPVTVVKIVNEVVVETVIENHVQDQDHVMIEKEIIATVDVIELKVDQEVEKEAVKRVIKEEILQLIENQLMIQISKKMVN
jgi:hypothetical protein